MSDVLAPVPATVDGMGAATLDALEKAGKADVDALDPRTRARVYLADALVDEAQRILDEPLPVGDGVSPGAEATSAKNRADFRWKRAAAMAPATYGEQKSAPVAIQVNVAFGSLASQVSAAQDNRDFVPVQRKRDEGQ